MTIPKEQKYTEVLKTHVRKDYDSGSRILENGKTPLTETTRITMILYGGEFDVVATMNIDAAQNLVQQLIFVLR